VSTICASCGAANSAVNSFCPECGAPLVAAHRNQTDPPPLRPYLWENPPDPVDGTPGLVPQPPQQDIRPEPVGLVLSGDIVHVPPSVPGKPRRAGRVTAIVMSAVLVVGAGIVGWRTWQPDNGAGPVAPVAQEQCPIVDPDSLSGAYNLGHDQLQYLMGPSHLWPIPVCDHSTGTSVDITYEVSEQEGRMLTDDFTWGLQSVAGFAPAAMSDNGGYLWGKSVDPGQWLLVHIVHDWSSTRVTIQKGGRDILPDWMVAGVLEEPDIVRHPWLDSTLSLTRAPGWNQYKLQKDTATDERGRRYSKIVDGSLVGTVAVFGTGIDDSALTGQYGALQYLPPLNGTAQGWINNLGNWAWNATSAQPVKTTVGGCDAIQYTFTNSEQVIRLVVVQGPTNIFAFIAEVDSTDLGLLDEVQQMIDSAQLT